MGELELEGADSTLGIRSPVPVLNSRWASSFPSCGEESFFFFFATAHAEVRENPSEVGSNSKPRVALHSLILNPVKLSQGRIV